MIIVGLAAILADAVLAEGKSQRSSLLNFQEPIRSTVATMKRSHFYLQGQAAARLGMHGVECPFATGSLRQEWLRGLTAVKALPESQRRLRSEGRPRDLLLGNLSTPGPGEAAAKSCSSDGLWRTLAGIRGPPVVPSAGAKRPTEKIALEEIKANVLTSLGLGFGLNTFRDRPNL